MVQENLFAKPVDILTAPNGTNIDILKVNSLSMRFVKAARVYSAFTGLEASMSPHHPLLRAAQALSVKVYRFETQRLSGNYSYGTKGYYFAVDDVPKVLAQYYEHHYHLKSEKQRGYNSASQELRDWFQNEVLPLKGAFSMSYDPNSPQARKGALGEQIVKRLLEKFGCTVERPDGMPEDSATLIDWHAWGASGLVCVEVKTIKKFPYSHIKIPTFKIPLAKYEAYKREAQERGGELELYFVSSEDGKIYASNARVLDEGYREGGFEFPLTVTLKDDDPEICFCLDQFTYKWVIEPEDLAALRAIDAEIQSNSGSVIAVTEETELEERCRGHFGRPFPESVRVGLKELQQEFSDDDIVNAICALEDEEDFKKVLEGSNSNVIARMFLSHVRGKLSESKAPEEKRRFVTPNGTELEFCLFGSDMYVLVRRFKAALGYSNSWDEKGFVEQAARDAGVKPYANPPDETKYLRVRDIPKLLEAFIQKTSKAKTGSRKQSRAVDAKELLDWFNATVMPALYPNESFKEQRIGSLPIAYSTNGIAYVGGNTIGNYSKKVAPPEKPSIESSEPVLSAVEEEPAEPAYVPWIAPEDVPQTSPTATELKAPTIDWEPSGITWAKPYTAESMFVEEEPKAVDSTVKFTDAPERVDSLSGIIEKLAKAIGLPVAELLEAVRQLKLRQDPVLKELFGL